MILKEAGFLTEAIPYILYHHERYDGKGYPYELGGISVTKMRGEKFSQKFKNRNLIDPQGGNYSSRTTTGTGDTTPEEIKREIQISLRRINTTCLIQSLAQPAFG